ncbi:hypothetical protein D3C80_1234250 [compost metagenome]
MHAESLQLRLHCLGPRGILRDSEVFPHSVGLLGIEGLAQVDAVGGDDLVQAAELVHQLLRTGRPHRSDVQFGDEPGQGGTGGKFRVYLALVLQLQATLEQLGDHRAVVLVLEEAVDLMGHFQAYIRQLDQDLWQRRHDPLQRTQ